MIEPILDHLYSLHIPVSKNHFKKYVFSHPDYPSLLSISDTLIGLGIQHQIARTDEEHLRDLPFPYLIHLDKQNGTLALIKDQADLETRKEDMESWNGVVLKIQPAQTITDEQHNKQLKQEKRQRRFAATATAALAALLCVLLAPTASWLVWLLAFTSVVGVITGYLLLSKDLGITFKPVEAFCNAGKRTNCDRILHAEDAQLFSFFSFTDATAGYFVFQLIIVGIFILLFGSGAPFLVVLFAASLLVVPVIGYSLYYQYAVARTWCRLCLTVDGLLAAQVAIFASMLYARHGFGWDSYQIPVIFVSGLVFIGTSSVIVLLKNKLKAASEAGQDETASNRIKLNPDVFIHLLTQGEKIDDQPFDPEIRVGNLQVPIRVVMAANLHCNPCRIAFETIQQLVKTYPDEIGFSIRLTKGMDKVMGDLSASSYFIRYWQQHIYDETNGTTATEVYLADWYHTINPDDYTMNPDDFLKQHGNKLEANGENGQLDEEHYQWVEEQKITATPAFFMNGFPFPKVYRLNDLMAMIRGLVAEFEERNFGKKIVRKDNTGFK